MLHGFLKPAWQSKSSDKRCLAIVKMEQSSDENQKIFIKLANEDPSQKVRIASIKKLQDLSALFALSETAIEPEIKITATEVFASLIGPNSSIKKTQLETLLTQHPTASDSVIELSPFPELRHLLVEQSNEISLATLIPNVSYAETRCVIAEKIQSTNALELARKNLKGKDKKAERVIRVKLELIRSQQKQIESNQTLAEELLKNLHFIATHPQWRSEFKSRFEQIMSRWSELEPTINKDMVATFNTLKTSTQDKVNEQTQQEKVKTQQLELLLKIESFCCDELANLNLNDLRLKHVNINSVLADSLSTWLELNQSVTVDASLSRRFLNAERALEWLGELISEQPQAAISNPCWPNNYPTLKAYAEADELHQQQCIDLKAAEDAEKNAIEQLHKRLNRLMATTKQGDLRKARNEFTAVSKAVEKQIGKDRAQLDDRVIKAQETVQKMEDWHIFATEPKLLELCEQMENLATSTINADALAKKIAHLQQQWKNLGHSEASDTHWPRFKIAADTAYKPCADFFTQRKETQKANLQKREPFIIEIQTLLDDTQWQDQVDFKQVENSLKDIDAKWRSIKDVERHSGQKQWNKFKALKEKIHAHLDPVYDANIELKQSVVHQIEQLLESDLQENSLDKLKLYQSRWKLIGVTRRKQDQILWKEFKSKSDAVYEKISNLRSERRSQEDEQLQLYKNVIQQISLLAKNAKTLAQIDSELEALQITYQSLPPLPKELPEKLIERLEGDYQRAETNISAARETIIINTKQDQLDQLKLKASLCSELEALVSSQANQDQVEKMRTQISNIELVDKEWEVGIQQRLKFIDIDDKKQANEKRRHLCIELEILKGIDSPSEDKSLRMNMQLQHMQAKGLASTAQNKPSALKNIEVNWCISNGAEPTLQKQLQQRFDAVISK